jgi:hypothetical protein
MTESSARAPRGHDMTYHCRRLGWPGLQKRDGTSRPLIECGPRELGGNRALRGFVWVLGWGQGRPEAGRADP